MKKTILSLLTILIAYVAFGQSRPTMVQFGQQFVDTIVLPSKHNYIKSVTLYPIKKKYSKKYYNDPSLYYPRDSYNTKNIMITGKKDSMNMLLIPPLKPNRFYILETTFTSRYNIYGIFRALHNEPNKKWLEEYDETKGAWTEIVRSYNTQNEGKQLFFHPSISQLDAVKKQLEPISLNAEGDTARVTKILFNAFEILHFRKDTITEENILTFCKELKKVKFVNRNTFLLFFKHLGTIPDYLNLYSFYDRKLKAVMENNNFITHSGFEDTVINKLEEEKKKYIQSVRYYNLPDESLSNYIGQIESAITNSQANTITTFTQNYKTAYTRTLVPDFGYIAYIPYSGSLRGGSPYVGVHISLSPVNKHTPLKLSQLSFSQRFSIHTGVTLNSLAKTGFREDFFKSYSLMLGGGYKIGSQSTRFNLGTVLLKKSDAISGKSSLAIQPYVGLSIDIEIRKWLAGLIPAFTKNLKPQ